MWSIFTKVYLWLLAVLLVLGALVYVAIDLLNERRFENHVRRQVMPALLLIREGFQRHAGNAERQRNWLELTASLTGVAWRTEQVRRPELTVLESSWAGESARVSAALTDNTAVSGELQDWENLATGVGLLVLNELSLTPADERQAQFNTLRQRLGLNLQRLGWREQGLGFVAERNLARGQVVVEQDYAGNRYWVYVPAGADQALRIGPFEHFEWLTTSGIAALVALLLAGMAVALILVLRPLQKRLTRITAAVDRTAASGETATLDDQPDDALTEMWRHVNAMAARLIDLAQQSRQLNQAVSHDLKTPLARMKFALEMMDAERDPLVAQLRTNVDQLNQLIDELLTFHRLSDNLPSGGDYCFPRGELTTLLEEGLTGDARLETSLEWPHRAPVSAHHWRRLCRNLLVNAVQYGRGRLRVELYDDDGWLHLVVDDNGIGFNETLGEQALRPFVRGDAARNLNNQGHGMGLALCAAIVRHYGGDIQLGQSELGGARVDVRLPGMDAASGEGPGHG